METYETFFLVKKSGGGGGRGKVANIQEQSIQSVAGTHNFNSLANEVICV
jgi:hypothetical protein